MAHAETDEILRCLATLCPYNESSGNLHSTDGPSYAVLAPQELQDQGSLKFHEEL